MVRGLHGVQPPCRTAGAGSWGPVKLVRSGRGRESRRKQAGQASASGMAIPGAARRIWPSLVANGIPRWSATTTLFSVGKRSSRRQSPFPVRRAPETSIKRPENISSASAFNSPAVSGSTKSRRTSPTKTFRNSLDRSFGATQSWSFANNRSASGPDSPSEQQADDDVGVNGDQSRPASRKDRTVCGSRSIGPIARLRRRIRSKTASASLAS